MITRERIENYYLKVLSGRKKGVSAELFKVFIWGISLVYLIAVQLRFILYLLRIFRARSVTAWVISVGNITLGGTGKTPVVERLGKLLHSRGRKVAIISRGYRRKTGPRWRRFKEKLGGAPTTRVVSDGRNILLNSRVAGDEPYMLATNLEGVPVVINRNRYKGALYAIRRLKADTIILDDGFQHVGLKRDLDIVLIDAGTPFGNHHLFPWGILREPLRNLSRADLLLLTKAADGEQDDLKRELRKYNDRARILECRHKPVFLYDVRTSLKTSLDYIRGMKAATLAGIARPEGFEKTLSDLGVQVVYSRYFVDHHIYSQQELIDVLNKASRKGAEILLTTEKDAVRFPRLPRGTIPVFSLRVRIDSVKKGSDFDTEILNFLRERKQ
ncbi:MAG: tetraacyldisaccharide 4'-kinase [Candidatus Auribacterota bacterium]|nr:tetraacyldisaccharide 4'-kinase [Candidatus Auribacterota bacterium]